jgi:predicted AlkP superfamily phosphohydrolase/phosphomutase
MGEKTKLLVIGVDGATWRVIEPHLDELPNFKRLREQGKYKTVTLSEDSAVISPAIWCSMFSGTPFKEHGHSKYAKDGKVVKREDIPVKFCWEELDSKCSIRVLQVPFIVPPVNWKVDYTPVGFGVSKDENELDQDTDGIMFKSLEILKQKPDCFIVVFNALDRISHFHWGEPLLVSWYKKIDKAIGMLEKYGEKLIVVSDHGFCSFGEARVKTLPEVTSTGAKLKGDHHEEAILITRGIDPARINRPEDVYKVIMEEMGNA